MVVVYNLINMHAQTICLEEDIIFVDIYGNPNCGVQLLQTCVLACKIIVLYLNTSIFDAILHVPLPTNCQILCY